MCGWMVVTSDGGPLVAQARQSSFGGRVGLNRDGWRLRPKRHGRTCGKVGIKLREVRLGPSSLEE